jgi:hypothetical protein
MRKTLLRILAIVPIIVITAPALAADLMVPAAMQRCNTNDDCAMISNSCADGCGSAPANKASMPALLQQYQTKCGVALEAQPKCNMNPPLGSACINGRCTIDYAFANHAGPADYKSGAYPVPEAPVPSKVDPAKAPANDRQGFTAYDMDSENVQEKSLGQIKDTVYVPPSAPVHGGNYVPVTPKAAPAPAAPAPAPTAAPVPAPAAPVATPAPAAPVATPSQTQPQASMDQEPYATPRAPTAPQASTYVPAKPEFAPPAEPQIIEQPAVPVTPARALGASPPELPPMPPQPTPITASDLTEQRLSPPEGVTVPVGPNDPGATPPNAVLLAPDVLNNDVTNEKSFTATKKKLEQSLN